LAPFLAPCTRALLTSHRRSPGDTRNLPQNRTRNWAPEKTQKVTCRDVPCALRLNQNIGASPITECETEPLHPTRPPQTKVPSQTLTFPQSAQSTRPAKIINSPDQSVNPSCAAQAHAPGVKHVHKLACLPPATQLPGTYPSSTDRLPHKGILTEHYEGPSGRPPAAGGF
jgi:hypothetical protein